MENIDELIIKIEQMMNRMMDEKLSKFEERLEKSLEEKLEAKLEAKLEEKLNSKFFVFEQEYGTKIDAIFDAVALEQEKNIEKSEKIRKLDRRVDRAEANIFVHEKRISKLELNS